MGGISIKGTAVSRLDKAETRHPFALNHVSLISINAVGETCSKGHLPARSEGRQASLDAASEIAVPAEILVEKIGHIVGIGLQSLCHRGYNAPGFLGFGEIIVSGEIGLRRFHRFTHGLYGPLPHRRAVLEALTLSLNGSLDKPRDKLLLKHHHQ